MNVYLARVGNSLVPADDEAQRLVHRLEPGELLYVKAVRPRSGPWHRLYRGLCRTIGENQDPPRDPDSIDYELRIRAGHFDVLMVDGRECRFPKRIAFDQLTAGEWEAIWPSLELAMREHFGISPESQVA